MKTIEEQHEALYQELLVLCRAKGTTQRQLQAKCKEMVLDSTAYVAAMSLIAVAMASAEAAPQLVLEANRPFEVPPEVVRALGADHPQLLSTRMVVAAFNGEDNLLANLAADAIERPWNYVRQVAKALFAQLVVSYHIECPGCQVCREKAALEN